MPRKKLGYSAPKKKSEGDPDVKEWLQRIDRAKAVRKDWRDRFRVSLAYDYRDGAQRPPDVNDSEWYTINKVYAALVAELSALYKMNPYYYVKLKKSYVVNDPLAVVQMEQKAKVRQSMLNYSQGEANLKEKARTCVNDAYFQYGVLKTHYAAEFEDNPDAGQPIVDETTGAIYLDETTGEPLTQPDKLIISERYKVSRVHPDDFLFDADAGPLEDDWNWLAQRIVRPLEAAKDDDTYDKKAREQLKATELSEDDVQRERAKRKKGGAFGEQGEMKPTHTVIWEVYDLRAKEWLVVADGCQEFLRKPGPLPDGVELHPFSILRYAPLRDDSPYPIPPVSQWLDPQKETNVLRSRYIVHGQRFNRKYEIYTGCLDDPDGEIGKLESGGDGTIIRKNQPVQCVWPIADAPLDQSNMMREGIMNKDFSEVSTGMNQRGFGAGVESATEAGIIEKRIVEREGTRMGAIIEFVSEIGRKMDQLIQANITGDLAVKVAGPEGEIWEAIRTSDYDEIRGEYDYSVSVGSLIPQTPEVERAQWISFLQLLANAPQLGLSKSLLKRMSEMHNIDDKVMVEELGGIFQKMMGGQIAPPGRSGSLPGVPSAQTKAASVQGGMAGGGVNNFRGGRQ